MEKLILFGIDSTQRQIIQDMHRMAAATGSTLSLNAFSRIEHNRFAQPSRVSFAGAFESVIDNANKMQNTAADKQAAIDMGISDDLVGTILDSQKASVAFSALVQVRNQLKTGLDDVMNTAL